MPLKQTSLCLMEQGLRWCCSYAPLLRCFARDLLVISSHAPWAGSPIVGLRKEDNDDNEDVDSYQEIHFTNNSFPYCEVRGLHGQGAWRGCTREREIDVTRERGMAHRFACVLARMHCASVSERALSSSHLGVLAHASISR